MRRGPSLGIGLRAGLRADLLEGRDGHLFDDRGVLFQRVVAPVSGQIDNRLDDVHSLDHLTINGVLSVEVGRGLVHQEELASGRIGVAGPSRAQDSGSVGDLVELSLESVGRAAGSVEFSRLIPGVRVATLNHEARDHAVEPGPIVKALPSEILEVFDVSGGDIGKELEPDDAVVGFQDGDLFTRGGWGCSGSGRRRQNLIGHPLVVPPRPG